MSEFLSVENGGLVSDITGGAPTRSFEDQQKAAQRHAATPNDDDEDEDPMAALDAMMVTQEAVDRFEDPDFIIKDFLIKTHILALCGRPGSGKTTILMHLCQQMVANGYKVVYFNYDISSGDFKRDYQIAVDSGFTLIADVNPDKPFPVEAATKMIMKLASNPQADMSSHIFVFDTLKKFVDVMSKADMKLFMAFCRRLTNRGATVILPCHAMKYPDPDGFPVFDGVGDLRNDTDELLYLVPSDDGNGTTTVSVEVGETGKLRGKIEPRTFKVNQNREVSEADYVNVVQHLADEKKLEDDAPYINMVMQAIRAKVCTKTAIIKYCAEHTVDNPDCDKMSARTTRRVLFQYCSGTDGPVRWYSQRGVANNTWNYSLTPFP